MVIEVKETEYGKDAMESEIHSIYIYIYTYTYIID